MTLFRNELSQRRWQAFKSDRWAYASVWVLLLITVLSATAELWSNSKPLVIAYKGSLYFPVFKDYHPSLFGFEDAFVTDYRALDARDNGWTLWPVNPWDPYESNQSVESYPSAPTFKNSLGTDDRGRDVWARLLYGYRYSMAYAVLVWLLGTVVGTVLGAIMGYFGGKIDFVGQRLVEIWNTVPVLFVLIILISIFQPSLTLLVVLSSMFSWMLMSYYVRAEFLRNRRLDFVEAARALGATQTSLLFRHILPNSLTPIITFSPFIIAGEIYGLAGLDYLGFGLAPPTPSWGELLRQAQNNFSTAWWLALYPSLALFITLVLLSLVGQGVRRAFDPNKG
jgi:microcin C transport system permease protein